ncbi:MAG: GlxA family transcriptional regulator [Agarilytica sp.]
MQRITFICFDRFQSLDLTGPYEVFNYAQPEGKPYYTLQVLSKTGGAIKSSSGLEIQTLPFSPLSKQDTMVIVGGAGIYDAIEDSAFTQYIKNQAKKVRRIVSVCSGSFALAEAGLLTNKRATTHWNVTERFIGRYPKVNLDPNAIFVREGNIISSAGVTAGMDLCLSLVEEDFDRDRAMHVARMLVIYYRRLGGQSQFSEPLQTQTRDNSRFGALCQYIQQNPRRDLSITALATKANMSERHFSRRFSEEIGFSPGKYVEKIRLTFAKHQLENTNKSVDIIAQKSGFSSGEILRRLFKRHHGINPSEYRKRFGG